MNNRKAQILHYIAVMDMPGASVTFSLQDSIREVQDALRLAVWIEEQGGLHSYAREVFNAGASSGIPVPFDRSDPQADMAGWEREFSYLLPDWLIKGDAQ